MEKLYIFDRPTKRTGSRIDVRRKSNDELIGSFTLGEEISFWDKLDEQEQFEILWYLQSVEFNSKNFNESVPNLAKVKIHLAPTFFMALIKLWQEAKKRNIEFNPIQTITNALLEKAKAVERTINRKDGKNINILESLGIELHRFDEEQRQDKKQSESRVIFAELIGIKNHYNQFMTIAKKHFGKEHINILPKHIVGYGKGHGTPSKWCYAVALEVLADNSHNVFDLGIDEKIILELWAKARLTAGTPKDKLKQIFIDKFKPRKGFHKELITLIESYPNA